MMSARGRYDRQLGPAQRWAQHRTELIRATAACMNELPAPELSVEHIVKRAEKGRNTFYAHFSGLGEATRAVESTALRSIQQHADTALARAWAPRERIQSLVNAWLDAAEADPELFRAALSLGAGARARDLARRQLAAVIAEARAVGVVSRPPDEPRVTAAVGAVTAVVQARLEARTSREAATLTLTDALLRLFR
jgi:AcrR family transcriptional regulator